MVIVIKLISGLSNCNSVWTTDELISFIEIPSRVSVLLTIYNDRDVISAVMLERIIQIHLQSSSSSSSFICSEQNNTAYDSDANEQDQQGSTSANSGP